MDEKLLKILETKVEDQIKNLAAEREKTYPTSLIDIINHRFQGRGIEDMERYRLNCLKELASIEETESLKNAFYYAKQIDDWEQFYDFQELLIEQMWILVSGEVCHNLFDKDFSLSEIAQILPWMRKADIYALSLVYEFCLKMTEEELQEIKGEYVKTGNPEILEKVFGSKMKGDEKNERG